MKAVAGLFVSVILVALACLADAAQRDTVLDLAANPIPNLVLSLSEDPDNSEVKALSAVLEAGHPYLPGAGVSYKAPVCVLVDYVEIDDAKVWAVRVGQKRYLGAKSVFYLRGNSTLLSIGALRAKDADRSGWGALAGIRGGYKLLPFGRIIVEPFAGTDLIWAKALEPNLNLAVSFGVNVGLRLVKPNY